MFSFHYFQLVRLSSDSVIETQVVNICVKNWEKKIIRTLCPSLNCPYVYRYIEDTIVLGKSTRVRENRKNRNIENIIFFCKFIDWQVSQHDHRKISGLTIPEYVKQLSTPYRRFTHAAKKLHRVSEHLKRKVHHYVLQNLSDRSLEIASKRLKHEFHDLLGFFREVESPTSWKI